MAETWDIGDQRRSIGAFTSAPNVPADPSAVSYFVKRPGGAVTEFAYGTDEEVVKDSTGVYHVDVTIDVAGGWSERWEGAGGAATAAGETRFQVRRSAVL